MCGSGSGGPSGTSLCAPYQKVYIPLISNDWLKPVRATWAEARDICKDAGAHFKFDLAMFTIPHENEPDADGGWWDGEFEDFWKDRVSWLRNVLREKKFWAGYSRNPNAGGAWRESWRAEEVSNLQEKRERFLQEHWKENEPNNFGATKQECAAFTEIPEDFNDISHGIFDDEHCDIKLPVVCEEIRQYKSAHKITGHNSQDCGSHGLDVKGFTYELRPQRGLQIKNSIIDEEMQFQLFEETDFFDRIDLSGNDTNVLDQFQHPEDVLTLEVQTANFDEYFESVEEYLKTHKQRNLAKGIAKLLTIVHRDITFEEDCVEPLFPAFYHKADFRNWYSATLHLFEDDTDTLDNCYFLEHIHDAIVHFSHNYACTGNPNKIKYLKRRLTYKFCNHRFGNSMSTYF